MRLVVITHTSHWKDDGLLAYGPYVREMNLWYKHSDEVVVVAPLGNGPTSHIHSPYDRPDVQLVKIPGVALTSFRESIKTLFKLPLIAYKIYSQMRKADHIHLRCPGNIGLIGTVIQLLFPKTPKTVKYAGNWDPQSKQPWSYRLQKKIISNTSLSKNLKALVYGEWKGQSQNIVPFFTASYKEEDIATCQKDFSGKLRFVFVGSLVKGKRPEYAIRLVKRLIKEGINVRLDIYGDGILREELENHDLEAITFHGNQKATVIQQAYKEAHFLLLPSKSEGWPKVVAEAMFYGTIPLVTPISCVPWMLGQGKRGLLLSLNQEEDAKNILKMIDDKQLCMTKSLEGQQWSQQYTLDSFEKAIKTLLV